MYFVMASRLQEPQSFDDFAKTLDRQFATSFKKLIPKPGPVPRTKWPAPR